MYNKPSLSILFISLLTILSGCQKTREAFGLNRHQPDEFTTSPRQSLDRPANFELPRPEPGARSRGTTPADLQARETLNVATQVNIPGSTSSIEKTVLTAAGSTDAQKNIRQTINNENSAGPAQKGVVQKVLFWQKSKAAGDVIDPHDERDKNQSLIQKNKENLSEDE